MAGLIDCSLQLFECEFLRPGIAAVGKHGPAGKNLDVIDAVMRELTDYLPHFPRAVGLAVMQIPGQCNVGSEAGSGAGASRDGDIGAGYEHAGTGDVTAIDGVAQGNVDQGTVWSDIAHCGETGFEGDAGIGNR